VFLKPASTVVATQAGDYPEWHGGREQYSLWYIHIDQPELLVYLNQLRAVFSDFLYTPNQRQFHITLFICGFLTKENPVRDDDFSIFALQKHIQTLRIEAPQKFKLTTGKINSFESALFVEVNDENEVLSQIRYLFEKSTNEIAPLTYHPHLTLGVYHQNFNSDLILQRIQSIQQQTFELSVDQITFGTYQAQILQGSLYPFQQFKLESP
jgi:2'-5' RNA ligase